MSLNRPMLDAIKLMIEGYLRNIPEGMTYQDFIDGTFIPLEYLGPCLDSLDKQCRIFKSDGKYYIC